MTKQLSCVIIFVVTLLLSSILAESQPSNTKCSMQHSECLLSEAQRLLKQFVNGIPEYHVEKLDEMSLGTIKINADGVDQELHNVEIAGLKNAKINDVSFDNYLNLLRLSFDANLTTNAEFTLNGNLFKIPIYGTGSTKFDIKNIQVDMLIMYDIDKTNNNKHKMKMRRYRYGFTIKTGVEYDYRYLFNGDKKKSDVIHALLNKNWMIITNVFGDKFYSKIFDKIFHSLKAFARSKVLEDIFVYP